MLELFRHYSVWDYSKINEAALTKLGVRVQHVLPIGYVKQLTRIQKSAVPDIDVLFCGSLNPRRKFILDELKKSGLNVEAAFGVYGEQRDHLIGRSKLLLNMHFYDVKVLEVVRISYYLANHCAVLSERGAAPTEDKVWEGGVAFEDYDGLVRRARELCGDADELRLLALNGFEIMRSRNIEDFLRPGLEKNSTVDTAASSNSESYKTLDAPFRDLKIARNAECPCGSGKRYKHCHGAAAN